MNDRRFPRTLQDAFGGIEYGCALERPHKPDYPRALWLALAAGLLVALCSALDLL